MCWAQKSPESCEEACSLSRSCCCSRSHSLPPHTAGPQATLRPAGPDCRSEGPRGSGCQGRAALQSESESEFSSEREAKRRPGRRFLAGGAREPSLGSPQLKLLLLLVDLPGVGAGAAAVTSMVLWRWEPQCPFLWGSMCSVSLSCSYLGCQGGTSIPQAHSTI